uniref:Condensation domain-containing protein n=1 Tax=Ditylenchus dipsaci TaxID=166011 RepID=A0A915DTM1_9BILA
MGTESLEIPVSTHLNPIPLSLAQEQIGPINKDGLQYALLALIAQQNSLRTVFGIDKHFNQPYQQVVSLTEAYYSLDWTDKERNNKEQRKYQEELNYEFDLCHPSFRVIFNGKNMLLNHHHIITDGWSMSVFAKQFSDLYNGYCGLYGGIKKNKRLDGHICYADYALWNRQQWNGKRSEESLGMDNCELSLQNDACKDSPQQEKCRKLAQILDSLPPYGTRLIPDFVNCSTKEEATSSFVFQVPVELVAKLNEACGEMCASQYTLFLTAFSRCLDVWRENREDCNELVIGCAVSGREHHQLADLIGYFLNNRGCGRGKERAQQAKKFEDVPFHRAVAMMRARPHVEQGLNPVFQTFFNYRHNLEFQTLTSALTHPHPSTKSLPIRYLSSRAPSTK